MSVSDTLYPYFETGDRPTQTQFRELIDLFAKAVPFELDLGNGCFAVLTGSDAESTTYTVSGGTGTITLPAGVRLVRATIRGVGSDAIYSAGIYENAFRVRIVGGIANGGIADLDLRKPRVANLNNAGSPVSPNGDIVYDDGTVLVHVDDVGTNPSGSIAYVANKIGQYYNTWAFAI